MAHVWAEISHFPEGWNKHPGEGKYSTARRVLCTGQGREGSISFFNVRSSRISASLVRLLAIVHPLIIRCVPKSSDSIQQNVPNEFFSMQEKDLQILFQNPSLPPISVHLLCRFPTRVHQRHQIETADDYKAAGKLSWLVAAQEGGGGAQGHFIRHFHGVLITELISLDT